MAAKRNAALATAMVAVVAVPVAALAWFPLYRLAAHCVAVVPRPRALGGPRRARRPGGPPRRRRRAVGRLAHHRLRPGRDARALLRAAGGRRRRVRRASVRPPAPSPRSGRSPPICLVATWFGFGGNAARSPSPARSRWGKRSSCSVARRFADRDHDGYAAPPRRRRLQRPRRAHPPRRRRDPRQRRRRGLRRRRRAGRARRAPPSTSTSRPRPRVQVEAATCSSSPSTPCASTASTRRRRRTSTSS